jgi:ribosomal protein L37AE/L43A
MKDKRMSNETAQAETSEQIETHACPTCGKQTPTARIEILGVDTCPACTYLGPLPSLDDGLDLRSGEVDIEMPDGE